MSSRWAIRTWSLVLAALPACAFAESTPSRAVFGEITLNIDKDGKLDRAVLVANDTDGGAADLYIYLGRGADKLDLSHKQNIVKRHLVSNHIYEIGSNNRLSLLVSARCGGCSNDYETVLTIVYRSGEFLIGGFKKSWDLQDGGIGSCDINYLTGKAVASRGVPERDKPIRVKFKPVKLADWSEEGAPRACGP